MSFTPIFEATTVSLDDITVPAKVCRLGDYQVRYLDGADVGEDCDCAVWIMRRFKDPPRWSNVGEVAPIDLATTIRCAHAAAVFIDAHGRAPVQAELEAMATDDEGEE